MADNKSVTKKTAVKPSAPSDPRPAAAPVTRKSAVKKAVAESASPAPSAPAHPSAHPVAPAMTKAAAAAAAAKATTAATRPAPAKAAKKEVAKTAGPATAAAKPNPQPSLEEKPVSLQHLAKVTPEQRQDMVREAAYYKAEKRNFTGGSDAQDWADAEREIDELLAKAREIFGG